MKYELKRYSFGNCFGEGFNLYFNNFIFLFLISFFATLPITAVSFLQTIYAQDSTIILILLAVALVVQLFANILVAGLIILVISKKYIDETLKPEEYLSQAFKLIFPLIGLGLLEALGIMIGSIALIVPGIILSCGWAVATMALVVEKVGIVESLRRSWFLTNGFKGSIFGLLLVVGILVGVIVAIPTAIVKLIDLNMYVTLSLDHIIQAAATPIQSCILVVAYFSLRVEKEGFNLQRLADEYALSPDGEQLAYETERDNY